MSVDYQAVATAGLTLFKELRDASDWGNSATTDGISTSQKPFPGSSINAYKGVLVIPGVTPEEVAAKWWDVPYPKQKEWDPDCVLHEVVEDVNSKLRVRHMVQKLSWPIWSRDFVTVQFEAVEGGVIYHINRGTTHSKAPEKPKEFVRGFIDVSGLQFEAFNGGTKVTRIVHLNPNGDLPGWLINSQANKTIVGVLKNLHSYTTTGK